MLATAESVGLRAYISKMTPNISIITFYDRLSQQTKRQILDLFSFYQHNYKYTDAYKRGFWNGKISFAKFMDLKSVAEAKLIIPTGLLHLAHDYFALEPYEYPKIPLEDRITQSKFVLRDYQIEALEAAFKFGRGIIRLPTGAGKTIIALSIVAKTKVPTIFIVNRKDLLLQTVLKAQEFGFKNIGVIGGGEYTPTFDFDVATIQTLINMARVESELLQKEQNPQKKEELLNDSFFSKYQLVIFDECHHINFSAEATKKVMSMFRKAWWRFGFSATPFRYDGQYADDIELIASIGNIIVNISSLEGFTANVEVRPICLHFANASFYREFRYHSVLKVLTACEERWKIIKNIVDKHKDDKVLIIAPSVEHCEALGKYLGIEHVHGGMVKSDRKRIYLEFSRSPKGKLVATSVYDEGVDFPDLNIIIFAEPFSSYLKLIQRVGRGRRIVEGKEKLIVYDLGDNIFIKQFRKRLDNYAKEGYEVNVVKNIGMPPLEGKNDVMC